MTDTTTPEGPEPVVLSRLAGGVLRYVIGGATDLDAQVADDLVHAFVTALEVHDETGKPATVTIQIGGE